ncbi:MAG: protein phosphatase 2C domain-containing protein [Sulfurovum sp.]|nr:protein phosphatase 2C domain-containing protein [Sulfurovum sp.]MCB4745666.1 protein phosphatase 2C domain-containing protein [Sulfurovum sp.]MCB4747419.1 protein phosphatase 2C domain-containing protein [Sulfurovum sp.]MCB4749140.1 protein phosphatase 2C domain-containing protein [Sulfurovum sp.]MCB4751702.1 protein phosphatase 2C domain-containing protein [Sulfurovum sp.]
MSKQNIETSVFSLAKGTQLTGDDYAEVKVLENITIAVVCDGVGSAILGAEAAKRTTQFLVQSLKNRPRSWGMEKSIKHFIEKINHVLYMESVEQYERQELVTTLTLVVIEGDRLYGANVGDSRIYLERNGQFSQLSSDHSMNEKGMENVLTSAIGLEEYVEPYYFENNLQPKDRILLCSDGLYNELTHKELVSGIYIGASFLVKRVSKKYEDNLPDDTTAVVVEINHLDPRLKLKQTELIIQEYYRKDEIIDGYRLLKPLIQNERTWLCENKGVQYVIKFSPHEALDNEVILDHFVKEVWMAQRLKAGFFPKAVIPKKRTHRYYIMSYVKGVPLKNLIAKKPLSVDLGIDLVHFLLKMAQYLIRQNLVHGDIKPENIIVTKRREKTVFKMVDFGSITEAYSDVTRAGTPSYLAPERFLQAPITEQTEVYAIGATLYEALTQKFPFGEIEPFQTPKFEKIPKYPTKLNPKIPEWLESVMLRAIETSTDKRYHNYSEIIFEIDNPEKVQPYFDKSISFIERHEKMVYKIGFILMFMLNIIQFLFIY